jgi:hypothetical protein
MHDGHDHGNDRQRGCSGRDEGPRHSHGHHDGHGGHRDGHHERHHDEPPHGSHRSPPDTEFLDLEISKVLFGEASKLAREVGIELLKEALRARLKERLGSTLDAIAHLAADDLADDVEANLAIEALIEARRERKKAAEARLRDVLKAPETKSSGEG